MAFDAPLGRTREYVDIVRMALRRDVVGYEGRPSPAAAGRAGKAAKLGVRPVRDEYIYLAAVGPENAELWRDRRWLAIFSPEFAGDLGQVARDPALRGQAQAGQALASTSSPPSPSSSRTTWTTRMPRSPVMPSTSGAWGRGRTPTNSPADGLEGSQAHPGLPRRGGDAACGASGIPRCRQPARAARADPGQLAAYQEAG